MDPCDRIRAFRDGINDRIQNTIDDAIISQGFRVIFGIQQYSICLGGWNARRVAHIMLERIVDVEADVVHRGQRRKGYRAADRERRGIARK